MDIETGKRFAKDIEETVQKGLVWKELINSTKDQEDKTGWSKHVEGDLFKRKREGKVAEEWKERSPESVTVVQMAEDSPGQNPDRSWFFRPRTSLKGLFLGSNEPYPDPCEGISSGLLHSEACRGDPSLRKSDFVISIPFMIYMTSFLFLYIFLCFRI